jgi:hypothetical protein
MPDEEITPPTKVKFVYKKAGDYKQCFVNGAYGGFSPRGDFVCDFFFEFKEFPTEQEGNINPETNQLDIDPTPNPEITEIIREVRLGIVMSPQQMIHLRDWLDKRIADFKEKYEVDA